jgi:hypothetical protein
MELRRPECIRSTLARRPARMLSSPRSSGRASVRHSRAVSTPPVRSVHPMDPIGSVGRGWLMGPLSSMVSRSGGGDKHGHDVRDLSRGRCGEGAAPPRALRPTPAGTRPTGARSKSGTRSCSASSPKRAEERSLPVLGDRLPRLATVLRKGASRPGIPLAPRLGIRLTPLNVEGRYQRPSTEALVAGGGAVERGDGTTRRGGRGRHVRWRTDT